MFRECIPSSFTSHRVSGIPRVASFLAPAAPAAAALAPPDAFPDIASSVGDYSASVATADHHVVSVVFMVSSYCHRFCVHGASRSGLRHLGGLQAPWSLYGFDGSSLDTSSIWISTHASRSKPSRALRQVREGEQAPLRLRHGVFEFLFRYSSRYFARCCLRQGFSQISPYASAGRKLGSVLQGRRARLHCRCRLPSLRLAWPALRVGQSPPFVRTFSSTLSGCSIRSSIGASLGWLLLRRSFVAS